MVGSSFCRPSVEPGRPYLRRMTSDGQHSAAYTGSAGVPSPNIDRPGQASACSRSGTPAYGRPGASSLASRPSGPASKVGLRAPRSPAEGRSDHRRPAQTLGYATGQFGKNHLGDRNEFLPTVHGFDSSSATSTTEAEEEPENRTTRRTPSSRRRFGPRGVLHTCPRTATMRP